MLKKAFSYVPIALLVVSCYGSDVIKPAEGPGTAYPCGIQGKSCQPVSNGCCPLDHTCGYKGPWSRCEEGFCCYDGPTDTAYPGGVHRPIQQTPPLTERR